MSHPIHGALMSASSEFLSMYNDDDLSTGVLSEGALTNIIQPNAEFLRAADQRYRLDELLSAMLAHAPHPLGKRFVAVTLHVAHRQGMAAVVDVAASWMDHLFLPLLMNAGTITKPSTDPRSDEYIRRAKVSIRERHFCAITRTVDAVHARLLRARGLRAPAGVERRMIATYIIPPTLNRIVEAATSPGAIDSAGMDIFSSWTGISPKKLTGSRLHSPANTILMTVEEDLDFGRFEIYLDKDVYPNIPNKYRVKLIGLTIQLSTEVTSMDVEFRTGVEGIEPPDPEYLAIHAAIAKVVNICGAAAFVDGVKWDAEHSNPDVENIERNAEDLEFSP